LWLKKDRGKDFLSCLCITQVLCKFKVEYECRKIRRNPAINRVLSKCEITGTIFIRLEEVFSKQKRIRTQESSECLTEADAHSI
jgi:hypothetical protein